MTRSSRFAAILAAGVFLFLPGDAFGQIYRSISDATTPPGIANGAQLGSFPLSGFESVDLFSGALNFSLPVLTIGGRGEASYPITIPVENRWQVYQQVDQDGNSIVYPNLTSSGIGYGPSGLSVRQIPTYQFCGSFPYITYLSTRFRFALPNGEEHDLIDAQSNGESKPSGLVCVNGLPNGELTPYNRRKNFVSYDGSEISFVADSDVIDDLGGAGSRASGFVYRKDGARYRINSYGTVDYLEDRNGNLIRFSFCSDPAHDNPGNPCTDLSPDHDPYLRPVRIIDPLGRTTQIEYAYPSNSVHPNEDRIIFTGASGQQRTIKIRYLLLESVLRDSNMSITNVNALFPSATYFGDAANVNNYPNDPLVISQIVLPNGLDYNFRYNQYGELARATLPTGGYFEYDWLPYTASVGGLPADGIWAGTMLYRRVRERRVYLANGTLEQKTIYDAPLLTDPPPNLVVTATDQDAGFNPVRRTVSTFWGTPLTSANGEAFPGWREGKLHTEEMQSGTGALLRKTENTWKSRAADGSSFEPPDDFAAESDPRITQVDTTLDSGQVSRQTFTYDLYNNVTDEQEYDWGAGGPGGLLRHTETTYKGGDYLNHYLLSLPEWVSVRNASGALVARTHYGYDEYGQGLSASLTGPGGVVGHDDGNYGAGTVVRGNVTNPANCVDVAHDCPGSGFINHVRDYDIFGNVVKQYDGNNQATVLSYDGNSCSYSLPTTVTNALGQPTTMSYDCSIGKPVSSVDANFVTTAYEYSDPLERLTRVRRAASVAGVESQTNYSYPDATHVSVYTDQTTTGDGALRVDTEYDGLGRVSARLQYGDAAGAIKTDTTYDTLGRVYRVSNPYRPGETVYWTTNSYDALGRVTQVQTSGDNAAVATSYSGNQSTVADPAGKKRTNTYDALGRLKVVIEDPGGLNYGTNYRYDEQDDLIAVSQGYCPNCQSRTFTYDAVRRLLTAMNPESGTVSYSYDLAGNLLSKTDARGITTSYGYDALNRLKTKSYSPDGTGLGVTYTYDSGAAKGIGRLTKVSNGNSTTAYTEFDELGRVKQSRQTTDGQEYGFQYTYNLAGALTSETYPSGRTVATSYDGMNRLNSVTGSKNGQNTGYITQAAYWPHGEIYYYVRGNGVWHAASYNSRLQQTESYEAINNNAAQMLFISCPDWGSSSNPGVYDLCPHPASGNNNGNLQRYTEYHGGAGYPQLLPFGQSFTYDGVNRLTHAEDTGGWSRDFNYDPYGNLWVTNAAGIAAAGQPVAYDPAKNQIQQPAGTACQNSTLYDCAGNQLTVGGDVLTYDAENRQVTATNSSLIGPGTETYFYDGDGKRVERSGPAGTTVYVYDASGQLAAEYGTAAASPCQTCYLAADHLGSTRLVINESGAVVARHDYLPFGEEIGANTAGRNSQWGPGNDSVNQKFTAKERDQETGLDYFGARYFAGALGRFTSPDEFKGGIIDPFTGQDTETNLALPYADITDPQTLNKYAYVRNNPLRYTDPTGHCFEDACVAETIGATAIGGALLYYGYKLGVAIRDTLNSQYQTAPVYASSQVNPQQTSPKVQQAEPASQDQADKEQSVQPGSSGGPTEGKRFSPKQRAEDAGKACAYCKQPTTEEPGKPNSRETDHADPRSRGGNTEPTNRNPTCRTCNREKGNKNIEEYKRYRKEKYGESWLFVPDWLDRWMHNTMGESIWISDQIS